MSIAIVLLTVAPAVCPLAAHDEEQPFAAVLQRVIRASRENFRPVEGARIEMHPGNLSYFQARVDLPGTKECRIDEHPNPVYSCRWQPPSSAPPGPVCARILSDIDTALGPEWSRGHSPQSAPAVFRNTGRYRLTKVTVTPPSKGSAGCVIAISVPRSSGTYTQE
jgi:hypothetical protein